MARFTVPVKWNDEWFSNLKPIEKLIFLYLTDRCDNAGFFEINKRIDSFLIGISQDEFVGYLNAIKKCYIASKDLKKVWLKNYLKHQRNLPLNPENNAHKQIILIIQSNENNFEYDFNILAPNKGLFRAPGNVMYIGNVKEEKSIIEKKEEKNDVFWVNERKAFFDSSEWVYKFCSDKKITLPEFKKYGKIFIDDLELKEDFKDLKEMRRHFTNWYNKNILNGHYEKIEIDSKKNGLPHNLKTLNS